MIAHIVRKEILELVRDGRFRWGTGLVAALLAFALVTGWAYRNDVAVSHSAASELARSQWLEQEEKTPHAAAHYGVYVFKPVSTLSLLDRGIDPYTGVTTWLEAHRQNPFSFRPVQDTPALARFGELSAATTLQLFVPLLIVLLTFSAFTGERESGTLRQVMGIGVPASRLAIGKVLGVGAALALLVVPAALLGALALVWAGPGEEAGLDTPVRYLALAGAYAAYFAMFVLLGLAVSAFASSSRTALLVLLAFCIANALIAPRLAADIARAVAPLPSTEEFQATVRREQDSGFDGYPGREERAAKLLEETLQAHGVTTLEELPFNYSGLSLQAGEEYADLVWDRNFGALGERIADQEQTHRWLGLAAPHLAIRSLSMALTATDPAHHQRFAQAAEQYRRLIQRAMNNDIMTNSVYGQTYLAGPQLWSQLPEFEYVGPGIRAALDRQGLAMLDLAVWVGAAAVLLWLGIRRLSSRL